jgi:hypothetical protein
MTEKMLEKWAEAIAETFFNESIPLNDGVTKVATEANLNPEQIKRLVEAVNTTTFLQKFNGMADPDSMAHDRVVEFETADPNIVISRMLKSAKDSMSHGSDCPHGKSHPGCGESACPCDGDDLTMSLPVTRSDKAPLPPEKVASAPPEPRIEKHIVVNRLHKTADMLKASEYQARVSFTEAVQGLTTRFRRLNGASFEVFEKDAFYHYGGAAAPHLQFLRQALRKPTADYDLTDMRKHARFVNLKTPEMRHLQEMMNWTKHRKYAAAALKKVEADLARIA